tara:strand:- start:688 stop:828 length:141 start_codon:yes stop_codon:yes gene_type:complete
MPTPSSAARAFITAHSASVIQTERQRRFSSVGMGGRPRRFMVCSLV